MINSTEREYIMEQKLTELQISEPVKALVYNNKSIEAGWIGLKLTIIPLGTPEARLGEMREMFFAGAQYLFTLNSLVPDDEPAEDELNRLSLINKELREYIREVESNHIPTEVECVMADQTRNINLHKEAILAMTIWGMDYTQEKDSVSMDFWNALDKRGKNICREIVARMDKAPKEKL